MKKLLLYIVAVLLSVVALRFASVAAVDLGEVPLRLNLAIWLFGVVCAGFAALAVSAARRPSSSAA